MSTTPTDTTNSTVVPIARKRGKAKQEELPGVDLEKNEAVEAAAEEYAAARDERMRIGLDEVRLKGELLDLMHKHGLDGYKRNDISIVLETSEKVKVKIKKSDDESDESISGDE
jgi:hypothetical protein